MDAPIARVLHIEAAKMTVTRACEFTSVRGAYGAAPGACR